MVHYQKMIILHIKKEIGKALISNKYNFGLVKLNNDIFSFDKILNMEMQKLNSLNLIGLIYEKKLITKTSKLNLNHLIIMEMFLKAWIGIRSHMIKKRPRKLYTKIKT